MEVQEDISKNAVGFRKLYVPIEPPRTIYTKVAWLLGIALMILFLAFTIVAFLNRNH